MGFPSATVSLRLLKGNLLSFLCAALAIAASLLLLNGFAMDMVSLRVFVCCAGCWFGKDVTDGDCSFSSLSCHSYAGQ
jgi:hypothetical protein